MNWYGELEEDDDNDSYSVDSERTPIMASALQKHKESFEPQVSAAEMEHINKQRKVIQAVYGLNFVVMISCASLLLAYASYLLILNSAVSLDYIPVLMLAAGEVLVFILLYNISRMIVSSVKLRRSSSTTSGSHSNDSVPQTVSKDWVVLNDRTAPLALFGAQLTVAAVGWHVLVSVSVTLLALGVFNVIAVEYAVVPLLVFFLMVLISATLTTWIHLLQAMSAALLCLFFSLLLANDLVQSWYLVFAPVILLTLLWVAVLFHIVYLHRVEAIRLKNRQVRHLILYMLGFTLALGSLAVMYSSNWTLNTLSQWLWLGSFVLLSIAFSLDSFEYLDNRIRAHGAAQPKSLRKARLGGWVIDRTRRVRNYVILGDLLPVRGADSGLAADDDDTANDSEPTQSCWSTCCFLVQTVCFRESADVNQYPRSRRQSIRSETSDDLDDRASVLTDDLVFFGDEVE